MWWSAKSNHSKHFFLSWFAYRFSLNGLRIKSYSSAFWTLNEHLHPISKRYLALFCKTTEGKRKCIEAEEVIYFHLGSLGKVQSRTKLLLFDIAKQRSKRRRKTMKEEKENAINKGIDEKYFNILNSSGTKGNEL